MSMFTGKVNARLLLEALEKAPARLNMRMKEALQDAGMDLDRRVQTERLRGRPGLRRRTGRLAQGFHVAVSGSTLDDMRMVYGTNVAYARIHEYGGTVRPVRAQWLTIPLPANLTAAGVTRRPISGFPAVAFVRSRRGNIVAMAGESRADMRPMFVLKKSVTIPPRLGMFATWAKARPAFLARLNRGITLALQDVGLGRKK